MYVILVGIISVFCVLHCINNLSCLVCMCCVWPQHFSISNAGSSSSSNGKTQASKSENGHATIQEAAQPSRKFSEGPLPVVSSSNEPVGGVGGSVPPPPAAKGDSSASVISEGAAPNREGLATMKPPSLPPPSKVNESSTMPPPPSLPTRFAKGT